MKIVWTEHAAACLIEIEDYIAHDDPVRAQQWVTQLIERTRILAVHPCSGRILLENPKGGLRELIEGNYRIVYRVVGEVVEILTLFERHRLLRNDDVSHL